MIVAYASAGYIHGGIGGIGLSGLGGLHGGGIGHGLVVAQPAVAVAAPIAVKAGATSYQNSNNLALHPVPVAPVAVAHGPIAVGVGGIGLGHGLLH